MKGKEDTRSHFKQLFYVHHKIKGIRFLKQKTNLYKIIDQPEGSCEQIHLIEHTPKKLCHGHVFVLMPLKSSKFFVINQFRSRLLRTTP